MDLEALKIEREPRKQTRARRRSFPIVSLTALALLALGLWLFRAPLLGLVDRLRLPEVRVVRVEKSHPAAVGAVQGTASNGYIVAARRAALSADTPGRIVEMNVTEGSVVRKGDVVARLYSDEYEAALRRAEADLAVRETIVASARAQQVSAEADIQGMADATAAAKAEIDAVQAAWTLAQSEVKRGEELVATGVVSQRDLDERRSQLDQAAAKHAAASAQYEAAASAEKSGAAQVDVARKAVDQALAEVKSAAAARDQAQAALDKTFVRAPFDGVVVLKDAEVGEVVSPNSAGGSTARGSVVTMVDFASLEAQAEVPEATVSSVELGGAARIYLDAFPEREYRGRVDRIWPTANRQKGTIEVRVAFEQPDEFLKPEMGVRVVFLPTGSEAQADPGATGAPGPEILIPEECLVDVAGRHGVFVLERDVARFRELQLGERKGGRVAILSGLTEGELAVLAPPPGLQDGDRVQVQEG